MLPSLLTTGPCRLGALLALALLLGGCGDMITQQKTFHDRGLNLYQQGEYVEAAGAFRQAIREDPRAYESYYHLGLAYEQMGEHDTAIRTYEQALDAMSTSLTGKADRQTRLQILDALGRWIAQFDQRGIQTARLENYSGPHRAERQFVLGKVYRTLGDHDLALDRYATAVRLDPENPAMAKEYGLYLEQIGRTDEARRMLVRAYNLDDEDQQVQAGLRRLDVVPGASLKDRDQLARPLVPQGPIPTPYDIEGKMAGSPGTGSGNANAPTPSIEPQQAPRD